MTDGGPEYYRLLLGYEQTLLRYDRNASIESRLRDCAHDVALRCVDRDELRPLYRLPCGPARNVYISMGETPVAFSTDKLQPSMLQVAEYVARREVMNLEYAQAMRRRAGNASSDAAE